MTGSWPNQDLNKIPNRNQVINRQISSCAQILAWPDSNPTGPDLVLVLFYNIPSLIFKIKVRCILL